MGDEGVARRVLQDRRGDPAGNPGEPPKAL